MEHADDDILMDRRQHYRRMRPIDEEATPSIESMLRIVNSLTNRNFLIVFTIFIILIFQFRGKFCFISLFTLCSGTSTF
jgi:hypothetical protein